MKKVIKPWEGGGGGGSVSFSGTVVFEDCIVPEVGARNKLMEEW
jgi:hypothetical protein